LELAVLRCKPAAQFAIDRISGGCILSVEQIGTRIKVLDPHTVGMISAGEVVERPSSVVKELVENSLDAGSSKISIELRDAGKELIRVVDNGIGISRDDLSVSLERHSTSKIVSFSDLQEVTTLGFRGEALPSIAAISRMEILSKPEGQKTAFKCIVHGGKALDLEETTRTTGTTVTVRNLFYNTPVRKKFLKTKGTELRNILQVVMESALSNLAVSFELHHDEKCLMECKVTDDLIERVSYLFSPELAQSLIPVNYHQENIEIFGLISRPEDTSKGRANEYAFVNGRPVRSPVLTRALRGSYRATLKKGFRPDFFVFLNMLPSQVDVNIHPMKRDIKFKEEKKVTELVESAASNALSSPDSIPSYDRKEKELGLLADTGKSYGPEKRKMEKLRKEVDQMSFLFTGGGDAGDEEKESAVSERQNEEVYYPSMVQVHNTFIVVQTRRGILILDQHASHERVLYEKLIDSFAGESLTSQKLLFPLTFHLSPAQYSCVTEYISIFRVFGFEIEAFGGRSVILHSAPSLHPHFEVETAFREMIDELTETAEPRMKHHEQMAKVIACKAALKAGQPLSRQEMSELFDTLFTTRVPSRDIHGRPTMVQIEIDELKKRFERG
jgi:DNA mismatch repair protein MutL